MPYTNSDGLTIFFPGDDREAHGGEYPGAGSTRTISILLDLADYAVGDHVISPGILILPRNSLIESVETVTRVVATSGGSATLAVGTIHFDGSVYDADGLLNTTGGALANFQTAGESYQYRVGGSGAGAQVGTTLAYPANVSITIGTAAFTAGVVEVKVNVFVPGKDANPTQFDD